VNPVRPSAWAGAGRDLRLIASHVGFAIGLLVRRRRGRWGGRAFSDAELGAALRVFLDRSGVVGRKLGQFLALRLDLLPPAVCLELAQLFDRGEAMPFATVRTSVEAELGRPLDQMFRTVSPEPVAVGSIAQVHAAVALDGDRLALKVQRPGLAEALASEIRTLRRIAWVSDALRLTGALSAVEALDEFAESTRIELAFDREGHTADRLRSILGAKAYAPRVRWDLTAPRVLALEFIDGVSLLEICRLHETGRGGEIASLLPGVDLKAVVDGLAEECFHQLFEVGFFHGDPHPGNILIRADGVFVFLDFGIFGELYPNDRENLIGYAETLVQGRLVQSARYYLRLCAPTAATRIVELERELAAVIGAWRAVLLTPGSPVELRHISVWQGKVADLLRRHHVRTRRNLLLVWRSWTTLDSTAMRLPVGFDLIETQARYFGKLRMRQALGRMEPGARRAGTFEAIGRSARGLRAAGRGPFRARARVTLDQELARDRRRRAGGLVVAVVVLGLTVLIVGAPIPMSLSAAPWSALVAAIRSGGF
jgi:ubiquinone biosynthesis protein